MKSQIRFVNANVKKSFYDLLERDDSKKRLFRIINDALNRIEEDAFCGIQIPKRLIPKKYLTDFGVKNLWKYNLADGWRLIYSIISTETIIISIVLEWYNHAKYERQFKY